MPVVALNSKLMGEGLEPLGQFEPVKLLCRLVYCTIINLLPCSKPGRPPTKKGGVGDRKALTRPRRPPINGSGEISGISEVLFFGTNLR